jgi:NitT/TauT family transport system ATP-binding protein
LSASAISLHGVSKYFGNTAQALTPIDLAIAEGSFTAIVGPSGCGKSTLLRLIAGLTRPSTGAIKKASSAGLFGTSFVFQDATLMPWATAAENVALPLKLAKIPDASVRSMEALARVGLEGSAGAYPRELSGGMKMRVSIARAVVTKPALLLMDEPFAALDEFTRFRLNDDLLSLWQQHRWTAVFVTHSIREAVFLAQRVIVMSPSPGRIVDDLVIDLPRRDAALRLSHAFADECARVSRALAGAMDVGMAS